MKCGQKEWNRVSKTGPIVSLKTAGGKRCSVCSM